MASVLQAENITKSYDKEEVLKGISLSIEENTFTAVLGPSGSGKSTMLSVLSGLIRPTSGTVIFDGEVVSSYSEAQLATWKRNEVGHVFQNYLLLENLTVEENIKVGVSRNKASFSFDRLVRILELENLLKHFPAQLSGGQQQRVLLARALCATRKILLLDEPVTGLDPVVSGNM